MSWPRPLIAKKTQRNKERLLLSLFENKGIVSVACKATNLSSEQHYAWLKSDPIYATEVQRAQESVIDFVEGKLLQKINGVTIQSEQLDEDGNPIIYKLPPSDTAIIFYLKTRAKHRGYVERQEITGKDGERILPDWLTSNGSSDTKQLNP